MSLLFLNNDSTIYSDKSFIIFNFFIKSVHPYKRTYPNQVREYNFVVTNISNFAWCSNSLIHCNIVES